MIERAAWGPAVLAGLLGSTCSAALSSTVGASRILHALASHNALPGAKPLATTTTKGEPRNAALATAAVVVAARVVDRTSSASLFVHGSGERTRSAERPGAEVEALAPDAAFVGAVGAVSSPGHRALR